MCAGAISCLRAAQPGAVLYCNHATLSPLTAMQKVYAYINSVALRGAQESAAFAVCDESYEDSV